MNSPASDTGPMLWERQRGETSKAYSAFCIYRDAGAGRSIPAVAKECGKSSTLLYRWASRWAWETRAAAWDSQLEREALQDAIEEHKAMTKRQLQLADKLFDMAEQIIASLSPERMTAKELVEIVRLTTEIEAKAHDRQIREIAAKLKAQAEKQAASGGGSNAASSDVIIYMPEIASEESCSLPDDEDDETIVCVPDNGLCPDVRPVPHSETDNL